MMIRTRPSSGSLIDPADRTTAYAAAVCDGEIVAGPHVRNACRRHLDDLVAGPARGLVYDLAAAQHAWGFVEGVLKLSEGEFEGIPFKLAPSQAFKFGCLFGWKRANGSRRFRRAYIEEGKGNGKSPFAGAVGLYALTADGEAGAEIYAAGATKDQAGILFRDAVKMVRQSPALLKRLKFSGGVGREFNIAYHATGSFFKPVSKETGKTGSGPRPHVVLADEVHEHPDRGTLEQLEAGFKSRRQPLLLMITNSGSDRQSICWEEHEHAVRVAAGTRTPDSKFTYVGEVIDDTTFAYVCALDEGDDPLTDRSCWPKANPLLGVILTEEYLAAEVAKAVAMPGKLNGLLRRNFCSWTDSAEGWITREALDAVLADFDPIDLHKGKKLFCGLDLSGTRDLTAAACFVQTGAVERVREDGSIAVLPTYDAWIEAWIPAERVADKTLADSAPYDVWVRDEFLRAAPGAIVRFDYVAAYFATLAIDFDIELLAYDQYAFARFKDDLDQLGLTFPQMSHPQGGVKRNRPSPEMIEAAKRSGQPVPLGLWMPGSLTFLENLIIDRRVRLQRNPVLVSACMSAAIERDPMDNRWLSKRKATQRIDPLVALVMAGGAAEAKPPTQVITGADIFMVI